MKKLILMSSLFITKDIKTSMSYKFNIILRISSIFIYLIFLYFLSKIVNLDETLNNSNYFIYSLIGIAALDFCISISFAGSRKIYAYKSQGVFEELLNGIFSLTSVVTMMFLYQILIAFIRLGIFFLFLLIYLVYVNDYEIFFFDFIKLITVFFLGMFCYFGIGLISSSFIIIFNRGDPILYINSIFSFILGSVFYPIEILPEFLGSISSFIPLTYIIEISRSIFITEYNMQFDFTQQIFKLISLSLFLLITGLISIFITASIASKKSLYGNY